MRTKMSRLSLAVALATVSLSAAGQQQIDTAVASNVETNVEHSAEQKKIMPALEVIRVVGNGNPVLLEQTGTVVVVNRQQIEQIQPLSTEDILRRIPGINIKSEEETAIVANFGMRGLSASESKSLMLEDGVPVAPGLFVGNDRYFNPRIQRIEQVEVLKGSASLRYGPSTIGGVVNYQTKTPDDGVTVTGRTGSFNMQEVSVEAGGKSVSGDAFAGIVATHASSDGFMDKDYEMTDVMAKAGVIFSNDQKLGIKVSRYENDANISYRGLLLGDYLAGADYNPAPDDYFLTDRTAFDINHEWTLSNQATLKTLLYWSEMSRDYWRYNVDTAASNDAGRWVYTDALTGNNRSFDRVGIETRLNIDHNLAGMVASSEFGLRFMQEEANDTRIRAVRSSDRTGLNDRHIIDSADSVAAYAQSRIELTEHFAVTPGLRVESYEQTRLVLSDDNATASTSNTEFLPGVGMTYNLSDSAQLYGGVYRAFSPASNGVALDGLTDQQLDGERSTNYELGLRGTRGAMNYEVAAFAMDFSNQVVTGNSDPNLSQSNAGATEHLGMEFLLGYQLGGGFSIDSNATWVPTSEFKSGENQGNRLPYAPKIVANLALNYQLEQLSAALSAHHRGEQYGDASNTVAIPDNAAGGIWGGLLPSYTVLDITAQYKLADNIRVFGAVKNLTDKRYITGLRQGIYVGPERSFELGVSYSF
ncbi:MULTISPECIES: TonB-dependent receptor family protein [unclassified Arsukibacterium]|uniref:TonB-dependent receptor family protein n=1 Tax=unclassified Arsukibacterium TaxID=2635278 RepID=UPI000C64A31A|nr:MULTISPECIES: TonB-dependent receptor [unclassified Arsukibacterium]MAA93692.1 TonB-dependent siderophore receptor [Rheinheimera sp.]MBM33076.1 TonB-dependent siderophore receptor [Rheinheimera sp.]HAW93084.1 TonB-dependent siderophore receptor [Candidatus Azambacteria bacterium]